MSKKGMTPEAAQALKESNGLGESKLSNVRVSKGLSQADLSARSGISKRTLQCYEQQERKIEHAYLDNLCAICLALECDIDDILEDAEVIKLYKQLKGRA